MTAAPGSGGSGAHPLRIAHLASLHCGEPEFLEDLLRLTIERVEALSPDLVVVAGDLTASGYPWEYEQAAQWLAQLSAPVVVTPGNHDARNVGWVHCERLFGERFSRHRIAFDGVRAERLRASGVTIVAVDSSEPDLDEGRIGREWYGWIREQFSEPDDINLFVVHHHMVSIPGAGRGVNVITDAGDVLPLLADVGVDAILTGHKHVPYFWGLNGMLVCNAGTTSTRRTRGLVPPSWNEVVVDASTIKVYLHYEDGRRDFSLVRSRSSGTLSREAFVITDEFRASNSLLQH